MGSGCPRQDSTHNKAPATLLGLLISWMPIARTPYARAGTRLQPQLGNVPGMPGHLSELLSGERLQGDSFSERGCVPLPSRKGRIALLRLRTWLGIGLKP